MVPQGVGVTLEMLSTKYTAAHKTLILIPLMVVFLINNFSDYSPCGAMKIEVTLKIKLKMNSSVQKQRSGVTDANI